MCHQVLADVYPNALPDWDAGLLNKAPDIDDDLNGQPARLKVQKKGMASQVRTRGPRPARAHRADVLDGRTYRVANPRAAALGERVQQGLA